MTSRERLLAALRSETPDRVPVTLYESSPYNDGWPNREPSYAPLLALEREYGDTFVRAPIDVPILFGDPNAVTGLEERNVDGSIMRVHEVDTPRGPLRSVARRDPGLMTYWQIEPFVKSDADIERVLAMPTAPAEVNIPRLRDLEARVGDHGLLLFSIGDALGHVVGLFEFEDFVMRCATDDGPIRALPDKVQEQVLRAIRMIGNHVKNAAFRLWGPEYCGAPLMNPRVYFPRYVVQYDQPATQAIHETGNFSVIHCHGRLRDLLTPIAEIGADALEPVETLPLTSADVTLAEVKKCLGQRMCIMGGIQAVTLETGSPETVRQEVQTALAQGAPGGRYVALPTAGPFMVPLDPRALANAEVMFRTVHEHGRYG